MTEEYWKRWKKQHDAEPMNVNEFWQDVQKDMKRKHGNGEKHYLELYNICKSMNPYIRQIKSSPNLSIDNVAELICRETGCDLQFCMSLQKQAGLNSRKPIEYYNKSKGLQ